MQGADDFLFMLLIEATPPCSCRPVWFLSLEGFVASSTLSCRSSIGAVVG